MNTLFTALLQTAADSGAAPAGAGGLLTSLIPFGLIIVIFYFLVLRPQNKKQKETEKMLSALSKGDKIVTIGGIHGVIQSVKETTVVVKVDDNTRIEFSRNAISSVVGEGKAKGASKEVAASEDSTVTEAASSDDGDSAKA